MTVTPPEGPDTTTTEDPTPNAGHRADPTDAFTNQANKAPADQAGYDPKDDKWANVPGAAARANGWPQAH